MPWAMGTWPGARPADWDPVRLPYFLVVPYWNQAAVAWPFGSTRPCSVAPTGETSVAGSVNASGAAALAVVALSIRPSRASRSAFSGVRRAIASMLPPRGPWRLKLLTLRFPEGCGLLLEPLLA